MATYSGGKADPANWSGGVVGKGWYLPSLLPVVPGLSQNPTYGNWSYTAPTPPTPPPVFDPMNDPGYAGAASANVLKGTHAQGEHDYEGGVIGQETGYDSSGNLISDPSNA